MVMSLKKSMAADQWRVLRFPACGGKRFSPLMWLSDMPCRATKRGFRLELRTRFPPALGRGVAAFLGVFWLAAAWGASSNAPAAKPFRPEYDRDIRPILAENCYPCHGPDENKRKAKLRLDRGEDAVKPLADGEIAIVPGQPGQSKVVERINAKDEEELMPPVKSGKKLSAQDIEWITRWIKQGAKWQNHWSFVAPRKPVVPQIKNRRWPRNPIDSFILARLEQDGLTPSDQAPRPTLLRRLSLDVTGLPPEGAQLNRWLSRPDPVYAALDELLASPHYGERLASDAGWMWLAMRIRMDSTTTCCAACGAGGTG